MQICNNCIRGLTIGKNEVCSHCSGTGFVAFESASPEVAAVHDSVVEKFTKGVKKTVKKALKKKK